MTDLDGLIRFPVRHRVVGADDVGMRLDRLLQREVPALPMSAWQRLLRTGQVRVDGKRAKGGERLLLGQKIRIPPVRAAVDDPEGVGERSKPGDGWSATLAERICYRDDHLLVLDKPEGIPVHGGSGQPYGLVDGVRRMMEMRHDVMPELCHRLDKDTSGCLVFGLDACTVREMARVFRDGEVDKRYLLLVRGTPSPREGEIAIPLVRGMVRSGERMVAGGADGKPAHTWYRTLANYGVASLVEAKPNTGRTHQLRVHFQLLGHPIAGDPKYGEREFNRHMRSTGLKRMFLHSSRISLTHPRTGQPITVEAPLDAGLQRLLERLRMVK
ncbi:MAG: RluA family pseudouridine synthase [Magnetococcales bacterium]|nr:RluA family pseudouridine synthase [Magnetococcales bacterium]MBF0321646.1 RluA family pseudouridine synthase [Magnetococcales bacterium]